MGTRCSVAHRSVGVGDFRTTRRDCARQSVVVCAMKRKCKYSGACAVVLILAFAVHLVESDYSAFNVHRVFRSKKVPSSRRLVNNNGDPLWRPQHVNKGEFSLIETRVAPATPNTRDEPDAMQLPLKTFNCGCFFSKSRLQAVSFFESFEYLEEYEEGKNGEMIKAQLDDDPLPDTPLARPDYLECSCRHKKIHIDKKLLAQGAE